MDELKIMADLIASLGSEARFAFVAWLIAKYGTVFVISIAIVFSLYRGAGKVIDYCKEADLAIRVARAVVAKGNLYSWYATEEKTQECIKWVESQTERATQPRN